VLEGRLMGWGRSDRERDSLCIIIHVIVLQKFRARLAPSHRVVCNSHLQKSIQAQITKDFLQIFRDLVIIPQTVEEIIPRMELIVQLKIYQHFQLSLSMLGHWLDQLNPLSNQISRELSYGSQNISVEN
jgi:hypothetical protein